MGMYTGLRCKIKVNEKFAPIINEMMEEGLEWLELHGYHPEHEFLKEFGTGFRPDFIPYGSISYMPDEWEESTEFNRNFDLDTRIWTFQCSLKNYEKDIQRFFEIVLPRITEEVFHLEYFYEEAIYSTFYDLVDGKIVQSEREGIKYGYDERDYNNYWG